MEWTIGMTDGIEALVADEVTRDAPRDVILLGASNLTISFSVVLQELRARHAAVRVFAAMGHGRSFGLWTRIFHRSLPGITGCGLWDAAASQVRGDGPTRALITDVGNDLMYAVAPSQIAEWVELCLRRLGELRAEVVMTLLPMASVRRLSNFHYLCARTLLFPKCRITWPDMRARAVELNDRLTELAGRFGATVFEPPGEWYGLDPIHIRQSLRPAAWGHIADQWTDHGSRAAVDQLPRRARGQVRRLRPAVRRVFGRQQVTPQPALSIDGLSVSLY